MALINARIGYKTIRDAIVTLLSNNSSTINSGLTTNVVQYITGDPFRKLIPVTMYPTIMVNYGDKVSEEFRTSGGLKITNPTFAVYALMDDKRDPDTSDDQLALLLDNIEKVFRDNITITGNVDWCNPQSVEFGTLIGDKGSYNNVAKINLVTAKTLT